MRTDRSALEIADDPELGLHCESVEEVAAMLRQQHAEIELLTQEVRDLRAISTGMQAASDSLRADKETLVRKVNQQIDAMQGLQEEVESAVLARRYAEDDLENERAARRRDSEYERRRTQYLELRLEETIKSVSSIMELQVRPIIITADKNLVVDDQTAIAEAVAVEREACAAACEGNTEGFAATSTWDESALSCARIIRARGKPIS